MNTLGKLYRTTIFGESHGVEVGVVVDGCPVGIPLTEETLMPDLDRRRSGAHGTTSRKESDTPRIVSGTFNGLTTGAPITVLFTNENTRSEDYRNLVTQPRPGHSDFVAYKKYHGFNDYRGGGHFSGRITLGAVVSGAIAKAALAKCGVTIKAQLISLHGENDPQRFPEIIETAMRNRDSVGGIVECTASGVPVGLGEPFFDSAESLISHAIFSIPAIRGIEFGEGFATASRYGSEHNDPIISCDGRTATNNAGGINGGITNGNNIVFRLVVKPTSSVSVPQQTINIENCKVEELVVKGRHDACIALRVPVVSEAMTAITLLDLLLQNNHKL